MIPQIRTQIGTGDSNLAVFNHMENPFNVGIGCVVTGTATYTIQHSFDDPQNPSAMTWFSHDDAVFVNATANANSNFAYPVLAARIHQTAGTGTVVATFIQAGLRG